MKKLIALILISTQAFAGLPPTTTKGQSDASAKVKFQFQAPHNQFTNLGGISTLIETGNGNILPDPGFEASVSGWTASGGATATANSTAKGTGAKGYDWDSNSAAQTLQSTSVTIPAGLAGKNGIAYCNIKTVSGTATHTFTVNDGTNDIVTPITIQSSTTSFLGSNEGNKINFVFPAAGTTIRIKLAAVNANEPEIYIDDCSISSLATNVYDAPLVTSLATYSMTIGATTTPPTKGTTTSDKAQWRRIGDSMEITYEYVQTGAGSAGSGTYLFPIPTGYTIDTAKIAQSGAGIDSATRGVAGVRTSTNEYIGNVLIYNSTNLFVNFQSPIGTYNQVGSVNTPLSTATTRIHYTATVPILGWSAVSAVSADQTDYDWTSYTPTFTGFGTVTSPECQHSRVASNLLLRCKFVSGTSTTTEARVSLPSGLTSADTTKIPSIQVSGNTGYSATGTAGITTLIEPSVTYITFGTQSSAAKANGSALVSSGQTLSLLASIPIQGWSANQRAPTLVGSVTSNSASAMRFEAATISNTGTPALVTQSSSWINSLTYNGTGDTTVNFVAGTFSSPPWCTCSSYDGDFAHCSIDATTAITSSLVRVQTDSNGSSAADRQFILMCIGNR